jgi:hypothetical protein
MSARWSHAIVLILLTCRSVRPDTITMKDSLSINGSLLGMSNGVLKIKARFPSEEKEVWIPVKDVQSIEFNEQTSNVGAPPKILGFGPPASQSASQKEHPAEGVIVLRGGTRQPCILVGVEADHVYCDPNHTGYNRGAVLRVVFRSQ